MAVRLVARRVGLEGDDIVKECLGRRELVKVDRVQGSER